MTSPCLNDVVDRTNEGNEATVKSPGESGLSGQAAVPQLPITEANALVHSTMDTVQGLVPTGRRLYKVSPWVLTVAGILAVMWLIFTVKGYRDGVTGEQYDENGLIDTYGVSLMVAEQAESLSWIEQRIAGAEDKGKLQREAIRVLEHARGKLGATGAPEDSKLTEYGLTTLACLYWARGDMEKCRGVVEHLPSQNLMNTGVLVDLIDGKQLDPDQWANFEDSIHGWPRDWTTCFLGEKAIASQAGNDTSATKLANLEELIDRRKQGFLTAQAQMSIVVWAVVLAGAVCLIRYPNIRKARKEKFGVDAGHGAGRSAMLPMLWPLSLAIIVFVASDFAAYLITGLMWYLTPSFLIERALWAVTVLFDSYWRVFGVVAMVLVFFVKPKFAQRTLLKPVPKLMYWALAALALTWMLDAVIYQLPDTWFPVDPTAGYQWEEEGWGGLFSGLIAAVVFAPFCEEMIFRGLLYNAIKNRLGVHAGVWISAIVFASVHFYGVQDLITVGIFGLVMGYLYRLTHSLLPCILCHALYNLIVTVWNWVMFQSPVELWKIV